MSLFLNKLLSRYWDCAQAIKKEKQKKRKEMEDIIEINNF